VIVLDTNVVSELMRQTPEPDVVRWVDSFSAVDIFLTAVTAAELKYGVARLLNGRRKRELCPQQATQTSLPPENALDTRSAWPTGR
jgi:predicted nucleic acid-binding protein